MREEREKKERRGIAGIWQCLLATFPLDEMANALYPFYDGRVGCRLQTLRYVGYDSLYRTTNVNFTFTPHCSVEQYNLILRKIDL